MEESGQQEFQYRRVVILPRTAPDPGDLARTGALQAACGCFCNAPAASAAGLVHTHATQDARHAIASRSARQPRGHK